VVVDVRKLVRLPEGIAMDAASALVITYGTTHYALQVRGKLQPGETLLVLGAAGGTGLSAIELGKLMGARVIAAASSEEKLALCRQAGADDTINYASEDLREGIKRLTGGRGVDVVYDPVGGDYTEAALRSMAWEGRLLVIGFTTGTIPPGAQPHAAQGLLDRGRVLRRLQRARARPLRRAHARAAGLAARRAHSPHHQRAHAD